MLQKILPTEGVDGEKSELEKLDIQLTCKINESKEKDSAEEAKSDAKQVPASNVDNSGTTNTVGYVGEGATGASFDPQDGGANVGQDQKQCGACTMVNPKSNTKCFICDTPF